MYRHLSYKQEVSNPIKRNPVQKPYNNQRYYTLLQTIKLERKEVV